MTNSAIDRLGNIIRSGGSAPTTLAPMGAASVASPLAALLMGGGINATQPAQPYPPGLGRRSLSEQRTPAPEFATRA